MNNIRKMRKKAKKKDKKFKLKKFEKLGNISIKKRMKKEILVCFLVATLLIRKNSVDSI